MRKRHVVAFAAVTLFALAPLPCSAMDLGFKLGNAFPLGDFHDAAESAVEWSVYLENEFLMPGLSWQARFARHVHDLQASYLGFSGAGVQERQFTGDLSMTEFILDAKFNLPLGTRKWQWFVMAGAGAYLWDIDIVGDSTTTETTTSGREDESSTDSGNTTTTGTSSSSSSSSITRTERGQGDSDTDFGLNVGTGFEYMINSETGIGIELDYHHIFKDFDSSYLGVLGTVFFHF